FAYQGTARTGTSAAAGKSETIPWTLARSSLPAPPVQAGWPWEGADKGRILPRRACAGSRAVKEAALFLYYFSHISRPLHDVMACLAESPERWLPGDLAAACEEAAAMTAPSNGVSRSVSWPLEVAVGPLSGRWGAAVCPIRAEAP